MTSVFYDVIYLAAIRGGTNAPRVGHFDSFLRKFEPQNVVGHRVDPQKALSWLERRKNQKNAIT